MFSCRGGGGRGVFVSLPSSPTSSTCLSSVSCCSSSVVRLSGWAPRNSATSSCWAFSDTTCFAGWVQLPVMSGICLLRSTPSEPQTKCGYALAKQHAQKKKIVWTHPSKLLQGYRQDFNIIFLPELCHDFSAFPFSSIDQHLGCSTYLTSLKCCFHNPVFFGGKRWTPHWVWAQLSKADGLVQYP